MRRAAIGTAATAFALTAVLGGCTAEDEGDAGTVVEQEGDTGITDGGGTGAGTEGETTDGGDAGLETGTDGG